MNFPVNFTPGPSQLYFTVEDHMRIAFREGIPSLSHRSKEFEQIFRECTDGLRSLLDLPSGYHIYFTGSATEIWERIIQNLVEESSFHLVNGSFSKRFFEISAQLNRDAAVLNAEPGFGFSQPVEITGAPELIAVTQNETSTGVSTPFSTINGLREKNPNALIAVDAVSSLPYPELDYSKMDTVFFSVQKAFGLPAGLGVWMVNDRCIEKSERMVAEGISVGSYHTISSLHAHALKNQTPETPNVLGIYLLGKVVGDMLRRGIRTIRKETEYKAALLYGLLEKHEALKPFVSDPSLRSKTVIVAECGDLVGKIKSALATRGMLPGDGYGAFKKTQLRFANFPTHSKEQFELLTDTLEAL
jgi:phosphoserine aminotransferase